MNSSPACDHPCSQSDSIAQTLLLQDVVQRFDREAQHGVCDTGRYRMPFFVWGNGPPIVFVHGAGDRARSFLLPMAHLSARFRCIGYDLPGGRNDGARLRRYRHDQLLEDLWALLDLLRVERAYIVGASFGATVALKALAASPTRLPRGIVMAGTAHRPLRRAEFWLSWLARYLPGPTRKIPRREKILELVHKQAFESRPEEVWRAFVDWTGETSIAALGQQGQWLHRLDLRPILARVTQPVLLVWGDRDSVMPFAHAETLRAALPSAGLAMIEGAGHVPNYSHPEALAEVIRRFLTPPTANCAGPEGCSRGGKQALPCLGVGRECDSRPALEPNPPCSPQC